MFSSWQASQLIEGKKLHQNKKNSEMRDQIKCPLQGKKKPVDGSLKYFVSSIRETRGEIAFFIKAGGFTRWFMPAVSTYV